MAQLVLTFGGHALGEAAIGGALGGPIGGLIGGLIGAALFGEQAPDQEIGRLEDLKIVSNTEGRDMPIAWGDVRVTGQMIVASDLVEHAEEEEAGKGFGGASYTTYSYTATWAVSFGEVPAGTRLRRVWANKKLIYDKSACNNAVNYGYYPFAFYDGTQTVADPSVEAIVGAGNAPAYTGQAILVAENWNLTDEFGNRPPILEAELCTETTLSTCKETLQFGDSSSSTGWMQYSPALQRLYLSYGGNASKSAHVAEIDPFTQTLIKLHNFSHNNATTCFALGKAGRIGSGEWLAVTRATATGDDYLEVYDLVNDFTQLDQWTTPHFGLTPLAESEAFFYFYHARTGLANVYKTWSKIDYSETDLTMATGHDIFDAGAVYYDGSGSATSPTETTVWALERTSDNKLVWGVYDGTSWDVTSVSATYTASNVDIFALPLLIDGYVVWPANDITGTASPRLIRTTTAGVYVDTLDLSSATEAFNSLSGEPVLWHAAERNSVFWLTNGRIHEYSFVSGAITEATGASGGAWAYYHAPTDRVWSGKHTGADYVEAYAHRLEIVTPAAVDVADILDDLCDRVGISAAQRDWSALTATVGGFAHGKQTPARADAEPLLSYALGQAVASDWKLKGVALGGSSVATLVEGETVAGNRLAVHQPHDIDWPSRVELQYMASDADLQAATASAEWYSAPGRSVLPVSWAMTMADSVAATRAQQLLQLAHDTRQYDVNLPPKDTKLEPGDVITLWDGERVRLTRVERGHNGVIACEALADNPLDLVADAVDGGSGIDVQTILATSPPQLIVLDTPLLRDADDDHPGPYLTAYTYGEGFPSGVAFQYSSDASTFSSVGSTSSEPTVATVATVPASVDWEDWDTTNTIRVTIITSGTLSNATNAEVLAGANAAAWGKPGRWEIVQWKTATLISTGVYDLSNLLRGRRGTDPTIDSHAADDYFVVLDSVAIIRQVLANAEIGNAKVYKTPAAGQPLATGIATDWTVNDEPLTPYTVINPTSSYTSPDLDLGWTRRTRRGGAYGGANSLTDQVGGPISEDSEAYTVNTLNAAGTVLGTYTATTNAKTLTNTDLTADYGAVPDTVYWNVAQNSAVVGAGHYLATQIHEITTSAETIIAGLSPDGFWKLDETSGTTVVDSSGNSNDGTYEGSPTLGQTALTTLGTSVKFQASGSQGASIPTLIDSADTAWSIVLFVNVANFASLGQTEDAFLSFNGGGEIKIRYTAATTDWEVYFFNGTGYTLTDTTNTPATGTTVTFALTFGDESGSNWLRFWVDGTNVASQNLGAGTAPSASNCDIANAGGSFYTQNSRIDCIAIWNNTTLTSTNISDIANRAR